MIHATAALRRVSDAQPLAPPGAARATSAPGQALFLLQPPYDRCDHHTTWSTLEGRRTVHGTIAGIRVDARACNWTQLEQTVQQLRLRLPTAPVILLLALSGTDGLLLTTRAARAGVRAVLSGAEPDRTSLRESLTRSESLAEDVVEWLLLRGLRLSPVVTELLTQIFVLAPSHPDLSSLLARVGMAETSARFRMQKRRLPPPSRWFQAARALHAALRIQGEPGTGLLRIAHDLGYSDHSALSQLVHRAFGLRPGVIRGTLGWEWLMERWLEQNATRISLR